MFAKDSYGKVIRKSRESLSPKEMVFNKESGEQDNNFIFAVQWWGQISPTLIVNCNHLLFVDKVVQFATNEICQVVL